MAGSKASRVATDRPPHQTAETGRGTVGSFADMACGFAGGRSSQTVRVAARCGTTRTSRLGPDSVVWGRYRSAMASGHARVISAALPTPEPSESPRADRCPPLRCRIPKHRRLAVNRSIAGGFADGVCSGSGGFEWASVLLASPLSMSWSGDCPNAFFAPPHTSPSSSSRPLSATPSAGVGAAIPTIAPALPVTLTAGQPVRQAGLSRRLLGRDFNTRFATACARLRNG